MKEIVPILGQDKNDQTLVNLLKDKKSVKMNDEDLTYLHIFRRPSFDESPKQKYKYRDGDDDIKTSDYSPISVKDIDDMKVDYAFPKNIFNLIFYLWTRRATKAANSNPNGLLTISNLGEFQPDYHPDIFLNEIKTEWQQTSNKTKSSPLIKTLLKRNYGKLILAFIGSLIVLSLDSCVLLLYEQIIMHLDKDSELKPKFSLLTTITLLLVAYLTYTIFFRALEAYTGIYSYKIVAQLDLLIYDKLLRISPYANCSEGALVNFIQSDAEAFGEFFTYTPTTLVLPFQIMFYSYLLFIYFGWTFIFGVLTLVVIIFAFIYLQKIRNKYQKEMLIKKDRRMKTTTQIFEKIKIVKLYSWENYYLEKIKREREEELIAFRKTQLIYLLIDSITWSIGPILNFVSVFTYNIFNDPMELSKLLSSLFIFHNLTDPLFLIPEYVSGFMDSMLSLKRLEAFLYSKEYNPSQLVNLKDDIKKSKNPDDKSDEIVINIDDMDFGIIKKEEEFLDFEEEESSDEEEEEQETKNEKKAVNIELGEMSGKSEREEKLLLSNESTKNNQSILNILKKRNENEIEEKKPKKEKEVIVGVVTETLLTGINLKIKKGKIFGIVGEFGSGKTCLFNAILTNLDILNSDKKVIINGSVAYVPQISWILNDTVRNNITFHNKYIGSKYDKVVNICQLEPDFEILKSGDLTQISDKGDNLSGGQKARINIARAVYNDADIYLFDDPFSALDAYVGSAIFNKVILGYLKGKTILIITHALQYIPMMDYVIHMDDGKIDYFGEAKEAVEQPFFKELISSAEQKKFSEMNEKQNKKNEEETNRKLEKESAEIESDDSSNIITKIERKFGPEKRGKFAYKKPSKIQGFKIVFNYAGGFKVFFAIFFVSVLWKLSDSGSDFIITYWSSGEEHKSDTFFNYYLITKLSGIGFSFLKSYILVQALISFNRNMHETLLVKLLRAPINLFHDIVKRSHIINRLSKDLSNSVKYFWSLNSSLIVFFHIISSLFLSIFFFWRSVFACIILLLINIRLYRYYLKAAKGLNLLETTTRVPILSGVSETHAGNTSIRAYKFEKKFQESYHKKIYDFYRVLVYQDGTSSWFALNVDIVCFLFLFIVLIFTYFFKNLVSAGVLGMLINYLLKLVEQTYNFFNHFNILERTSTSMESCDAYTHVVQEAPLELETDKILMTKDFPQTGKIDFINYSVKYRPDTKIVLKNLNFSIKHGEKIGVVGRTGSGKSTLCLCLFRIIEASSGKILIDDIDISLIGLALLRSIITVIPQDPTLIEGTLRENLDPLGKYDDDTMKHQLNLLGMAYLLEDDGLNFFIKEDGINLSAGEKQLICMARAMLRKSKIMVMDEATASVDYSSEALIQKALTNTLNDTTVITIAHRIKTIIGYDRIFVFDKGQLAEEGSPKELIESKKGHFYTLYTQSHV